MTATRLDSAGRTGLEPASALESRAHAAGGLPTIVLVHGAWTEPAGWDEVAAGLQEDGYATRTRPLGLQSSCWSLIWTLICGTNLALIGPIHTTLGSGSFAPAARRFGPLIWSLIRPGRASLDRVRAAR